jgi:hypothetical protein
MPGLTSTGVASLWRRKLSLAGYLLEGLQWRPRGDAHLRQDFRTIREQGPQLLHLNPSIRAVTCSHQLFLETCRN